MNIFRKFYLTGKIRKKEKRNIKEQEKGTEKEK